MPESCIQRCPHDEENPYAQISNALIRDASISPNCRWLISYLLSNKDNWTIKVSQLATHLKPHFSKKKVLSIINEAIEAGYMQRIQKKEGNKFTQVSYFVSERPKFKEILPQSHFGVAQKRPTKEQTSSFSLKKNNKTKPVRAAPPAERVPPVATQSVSVSDTGPERVRAEAWVHKNIPDPEIQSAILNHKASDILKYINYALDQVDKKKRIDDLGKYVLKALNSKFNIKKGVKHG